MPRSKSPKPNNWNLYKGDGEMRSISPNDLPAAPPWREFRRGEQDDRKETFQPPSEAIEMVNAALSLRRPLLITGNPGTGKSSLAYAVARELGLGAVLKWAITTRTTLKDGLYGYDAIARLQDAQLLKQGEERPSIGEYITLGALGTAFLATELPRVLLIDEIDKSDIDLPNDLLNLFEDGEFAIPELQRVKEPSVTVRTIDRAADRTQQTATILDGVVRCGAFPLVIMTSNGERDFPAPFLRRCLRFRMPNPNVVELGAIVSSHLGESAATDAEQLIQTFYDRVFNQKEMLATDQLLNVIHLRLQENSRDEQSRDRLEKRLLKDLNSPEEL
jgi:MoxR-like ATPase